MKHIIISIDFGHGETAACVRIEGKIDVECIPLRHQKNNQGRQIPSVIATDMANHYVINPSMDNNTWAILLSFKDKIDVTLLDKSVDDALDDKMREKIIRQQAFKAFIQEVYKRVCKCEFWEEETCNEIFIASPTKWNEKDKRDYREFVESAINEINQEKNRKPISIGWVMNESDAAYFAFKDTKICKENGVVLIVGFGSSTIDFTLMIDGIKQNIDNLSCRDGASNVEITLFDDFLANNPDVAKQIQDATAKIREKSGNPYYDEAANILYQFRKQKEIAYAGGQKHIFFLYENPCGDNSIVLTPQIINFESKIEPYKNQVKKDFEHLRDELLHANILNGRKIDHIILTGGASMMPWVKTSLEEVFNEKDRFGRDVFGKEVIIDKENPSFVVAKGIANYAYELHKCKEEVIEMFDEWWKENNKEIRNDIETITNNEIKRYMQNGVEGVLQEYINDDVHTTYIDLANKIQRYLEQASQDPNNLKKMSSSICSNLEGKLSPIVADILAKHFNKKVGCQINIQGLRFSVDNKKVVSFIKSTKWCPDDNPKDANGRKDISNKVRKHLEKDSSFPIRGEISDNEYNKLVKQIKDNLVKWVEENKPFMLVQ